MTVYGVDLSHWDHVTNWQDVRNNGIEFASIKLTEGSDWDDPAAQEFVPGARSVGIVPGGYHYARDTDIPAQAAHFENRLANFGLLNDGNLWPMVDMEDAALRGTADGFLQEFIHQYRSVSGQPNILVYANLDWFTHVLNPDSWMDDHVRLWVANWNGEPGNTEFTHPNVVLHQHTNKGIVPGIPGWADRDATVDFVTLDSLTIGGQPAPPAPNPVPEPAPDTYTVQAGDTLSGIAERFGTTWQELQRINSIPDANLIFPGQVIQLHGTDSQPGTYTVKAGDTLGEIAMRFGTTWPELQRINNIPDANLIYPGQVLRLR